MLNVLISVGDGGVLPTRATRESAGFDLYSPLYYNAQPRSNIVIDTLIGLAYKSIPEGFIVYAQIKGRSGLSIKTSIEVCNAGVIDQDYRGTIKIKLYNNSDKIYKICKGDRIAQIIFFLIPKVVLTPVKTEEFTTLFNTERGNNGLGSSGK